MTDVFRLPVIPRFPDGFYESTDTITSPDAFTVTANRRVNVINLSLRGTEMQAPSRRFISHLVKRLPSNFLLAITVFSGDVPGGKASLYISGTNGSYTFHSAHIEAFLGPQVLEDLAQYYLSSFSRKVEVENVFVPGARSLGVTTRRSQYTRLLQRSRQIWDTCNLADGSAYSRIGGRNIAARGRTFGLEIEVDFPDDHLHEQRHVLAERLYIEGLSRYSSVRGWHAQARDGVGGEPGYSFDCNTWTVEFDRSVDDVGGVRGCELVSPIFSDTPQAWENIGKVLSIVEELGGQVTFRTGLHVNVGLTDMGIPTALQTALQVYRLHYVYDDLLLRVASNTPSGSKKTHRGSEYCRPLTVNPLTLTSGEVRSNFRQVARSMDHRSTINFQHVSRNDHSRRIEFRYWDGTLSLARVKAVVTLCLAMVAYAYSNRATTMFEGALVAVPRGFHVRQRAGEGASWSDTPLLRQFIDLLELDEVTAAQVVAMYNEASWASYIG